MDSGQREEKPTDRVDMKLSWRTLCLLDAVRSFLPELLFNSQPVLVLLLIRHLNLNRQRGCLMASLMTGVAAISEGLVVSTNPVQPPTLLTAFAATLACVGPALSLLVEDVVTGFAVASAVYGLGVGLSRGLTSNSRDEADAYRDHLNRQMVAVLGGFVGCPLLLILEALLALTGATLILAALGLHAVVIVIVQRNDKGLPQSSWWAAPGGSEVRANQDGGPAAIESGTSSGEADDLDRIVEGPPLPQRTSQTNQFGPRDRVMATDCEIPFRNGRSASREPSRRRPDTEPTNTTNDSSSHEIRPPQIDRSASGDVLHSPSVIRTAPNCVSREGFSILTVLTPIEVPLPLSEVLIRAFTTPAFGFLLLSALSNCHLWMTSTTMLDAFADGRPGVEGSSFIFVVCLHLTLALANVAGIRLSDALTRDSHVSGKSIVLLANLIGGFCLLLTPFLHSALAMSFWAAVLGFVQGSLDLILPAVLTVQIGSPMTYGALGLTRTLCGVYVIFALPLFAHYYRDVQLSYNRLYQIFGLVQLGLTFLWLFFEPLFDRAQNVLKDLAVTEFRD